MSSQKTVMVLGAGVSGLCVAKRAMESGFLVTVFEKADQIGGLWYSNDDMDRVCMYDDLITNQPRPIMEYPDFFFDSEDQYFSAKGVQDYLVAYAKKFKVDSVVHLQHEVMEVRPGQNDRAWDVKVKDIVANEITTKSFDFVAICNGHYYDPITSAIKGHEVFNGEQIHSVKYRKAEKFRGKRVLVIGSGLSAMDIAFLLAKVCVEVYFSQRTSIDLKSLEIPDNLQIRPVVNEITETGAIFEDGSSCEVDTILYATGYNYSFPFLHPECGITVEEKYIQDLYKHCINIKYPTMAIIGMPYIVVTHILFDLQSQFVMKFWSGEKNLPSKEAMLEDKKADFDKRMAMGWTKKQAHMIGSLATEYHNDLADTAGVARTKPVIHKMANYFVTTLLKDFLNYRNECYEVIDDETFRTYFMSLIHEEPNLAAHVLDS